MDPLSSGNTSISAQQDAAHPERAPNLANKLIIKGTILLLFSGLMVLFLTILANLAGSY